MAGIEAQIHLADGMTGPLQNIMKYLNTTMVMMKSVETTSKSAFQGTEVRSLQQEIMVANVEMAEMTTDIGKNIKEQEKFNKTVKEGAEKTDSLGTRIKKVCDPYLGIKGLTKLVNLSDEMSQTKARLSVLVDGDVAPLEKKIFESAERSRLDYKTTADMISKMGTEAGGAFSGNDELIQFSETLNKTLLLAGNSPAEIDGMIQGLTQAMGTGVLEKNDLDALTKNTPQITQSIADYLNVDTGQISTLAAEGQITAQVIKEAMLASSDDINTAFEQMPWSFGQAFTVIKNDLLEGIQPILSVVAKGAQLIHDNWSIIKPVIMGVVTAMGMYLSALSVLKAKEVVMLGVRTAQVISIAISKEKSMEEALALKIRSLAVMGATEASKNFTIAQGAANSVLLASPLTWIIAAIIAIVAILYAVVAIINRITGSTYNATEMIKGAIFVVGAVLTNALIGIGTFIFSFINMITSRFALFANFLANVFQNPLSSIIYLFSGMADGVLGILEGIASAIDMVFDSNLAEAVSGWREGLSSKTDELVATLAPNEDYQKKFNGLELDMADFGIQRIDYGDAWENGKNFTMGMSGGGLLKDAPGLFGTENEEMANNMADTAYNTGQVADDVSSSEEDLRYLRDIAEQDIINRFTTAEIVVNMGGVNQVVNNEMDVDGLIDYMVDGLNENMGMVAEGVYN